MCKRDNTVVEHFTVDLEIDSLQVDAALWHRFTSFKRNVKSTKGRKIEERKRKFKE